MRIPDDVQVLIDDWHVCKAVSEDFRDDGREDKRLEAALEAQCELAKRRVSDYLDRHGMVILGDIALRLAQWSDEDWDISYHDPFELEPQPRRFRIECLYENENEDEARHLQGRRLVRLYAARLWAEHVAVTSVRTFRDYRETKLAEHQGSIRTRWQDRSWRMIIECKEVAVLTTLVPRRRDWHSVDYDPIIE